VRRRLPAPLPWLGALSAIYLCAPFLAAIQQALSFCSSWLDRMRRSVCSVVVALTDSFVGIVLAETFVASPFLIVAARSAFASVDPVLEDAAATLGRGRLTTFMKVSLPVALTRH